MNKDGLVRGVVSVLRQNDVRKAMPAKKHVFHISDDEGNTKTFSVKQQGKGVLYTVPDIDTIVDAVLYVICEAVKRGEPISIHGFGNLKLKYHKAHSVKNVGDGQYVEVPAYFVPKFKPGTDLINAAKVYEVSIADINSITLPLSFVDPADDDDDDEEGDD